jgi:bleomycin hydrolase
LRLILNKEAPKSKIIPNFAFQSISNMKKKFATVLAVSALLTLSVSAQDIRKNKDKGGYDFTIVKEVGATDVKNQYKSGTCWTYSAQSFLESEVLRMGKGKMDLSEMYIVRQMYTPKAKHYIRFGGTTNFGPGGEFHDVMNCTRQFGIVPQLAYTGFPYGGTKPTHGEMDAVIKAMLDAAIKVPDGHISPALDKAVESTLDAYLGKVPEKFDYDGKSYTSKSFRDYLGIKPDDYVEVTSFTHHPFYERFALEIPDNWVNDLDYNVPINELQSIVDNALDNGYTVAWAGDVSEKGFSFKNGVAIVPETDWIDMTKQEEDSIFTKPVKQRVITQELRQQAFDNLSTTDDHGMHIIGKAKDQLGQPYYIVKNSWGTDRNDCKGYFYASVPYVMFKTTSIMVNKAAVPKDIARKMKI